MSGAEQQFPQVSQHMGIPVEAQNASAGGSGCLRTGSRTVKRRDSRLFRFVGIEQLRELRQLQNFADTFGDIAELQIATHLPGAGQTADDGAEAAAVNELNFPQVQNDGATVAQQPGYVREQRFALTSGDNPAVAGNDGDASDFASVERKTHGASKCRLGIGLANPAIIRIGASRWQKTRGRGPIKICNETPRTKSPPAPLTRAA